MYTEVPIKILYNFIWKSNQTQNSIWKKKPAIFYLSAMAFIQ